jgi:hypothetical protein
MSMKYAAWGYLDVRDRILEAAETLMMSPAALGPRMLSGSIAEAVRQASEAYGYNTVNVRRVPPPGALSRMEETWTWINSYLDEEQRKLVYDYSFVKSRKGRFLSVYLERNGIAKRTFYDRIERYCQIIADNLNRNLLVRFTVTLDEAAQNSLKEEPITVSSEKCATHWIAPDAKPQIDPGLPLDRLLDHRAIRARHSDKNRSLGKRGQTA